VVLLTTVANSFEVQGRGCYIVPRQWESNLRISADDKIQLRTPDGSVLNTHIGSVELGTASSGTFLTIGLPHPMTKRSVPEGTEIWLLEKPCT
jgi:hypothetical protein